MYGVLCFVVLMHLLCLSAGEAVPPRNLADIVPLEVLPQSVPRPVRTGEVPMDDGGRFVGQSTAVQLNGTPQVDLSDPLVRQRIVSDLVRANRQALERRAAAIQSLVDAQKLPPRPGTDPGKGGGKLVVFWSMDAPHAASLAPVLGKFQGARPHIGVQCIHLHPLDMYRAMKHKENEANALMAMATLEKDSVGVARAQSQLDELQASVSGMQSMVVLQGSKGLPMNVDLTLAEKWHVTEIPSIYFQAESGRVHHFKGVGPHCDIALWMDTVIAWEQHNPLEAAGP